MEFSQLIEIAFEVRDHSYAPYSGFKSGAALLTTDEEVFTGCSIEVASFSPSVCAGHAAFINAISNGVRSFSAIAIVGGNDESDHFDFCPPSGVCRQIMEEFCSHNSFKIILAKSVNEYAIFNFNDLYPFAFGKKNILG